MFRENRLAGFRASAPQHWAGQELVQQSNREEQDGRAWVKPQVLLPLPACPFPLFSDIRTAPSFHFGFYCRLSMSFFSRSENLKSHLLLKVTGDRP